MEVALTNQVRSGGQYDENLIILTDWPAYCQQFATKSGCPMCSGSPLQLHIEGLIVAFDIIHWMGRQSFASR